MSDKLANEQSNINVVNWSRKNYLVVISGVNVNGMSYMHCPDSSMGMELNGITNYDMKNFRFKCSMILPEFERFALELSGNSATSTFSDMMVKILNNNYFRYYDDGELTIIKMRDSGEKIVINNTNGLVSGLDEINGFIYKGATSNSNSFCYHSYLTNNLVNNFSRYKVYEVTLSKSISNN